MLVPPPRIKPWKRAAVETVGRYGVFDVQKSEMITPSGKPAPRPFYTFACRTWCNVVAVTPADEIVLVWQYRHGTDAMSLEIPGGVLDEGETPLECARRELREETGYEVDTIEPLASVHANPALQGNEMLSFVAHGARLVAPTAFDETEECEVALVAARDVPALLDEGHVTHALVVLALERFLRRRAGVPQGTDRVP